MLVPGDIIEGKYRILRRIGKGGMGSVYEGENVKIRRRVAIKVLHRKVAESREMVQRFQRESQAAGRIGSDHIVEVLDLGEFPNGDQYMVMEYLEGESLKDRFKAMQVMTPHQIFPTLVQLLEGLGAAHEAGIIHRDLKPDNVFLIKEKRSVVDFVKILDFGVSKFRPVGDDTDQVTSNGMVVGTPYYMAPEQARGDKHIDHRADLFAVGVVLFRALTGRVPFKADTFNELMFKVALEEAPPVEQFVPAVDPAVSAIVRKALARNAAGRYQTAAELSLALEQWLIANGGAYLLARPSFQSLVPASLASMPSLASPYPYPPSSSSPAAAAPPSAGAVPVLPIDSPSAATPLPSTKRLSVLRLNENRRRLAAGLVLVALGALLFAAFMSFRTPPQRADEAPATEPPGAAEPAAAPTGGEPTPPGTPGQEQASAPSPAASSSPAAAPTAAAASRPGAGMTPPVPAASSQVPAAAPPAPSESAASPPPKPPEPEPKAEPPEAKPAPPPPGRRGSPAQPGTGRTYRRDL
ncbi:MAG: serine/threonine protein kinase [Deltaproteobacteria bacterium]|nr:serine/threonine protein kinase [Deltaproteobacteria bacterium]